jgi:hypothetical protein
VVLAKVSDSPVERLARGVRYRPKRSQNKY